MSDRKKGFTFTWKIKNFSMLPQQLGEELISEKFVVDIWEETEWYLALYPRGVYPLGSESHVSLYFENTPTETELKINYTLSLESTDSTSGVTKRVVNCVAETCMGYPYFISLIDLHEKKDLLLPNDVLTLRFDLSQADENSADENLIDKSVSRQYFMSEKCVSQTSILVHRRSMVWPIEMQRIKSGELQENVIQLRRTMRRSPCLKLSCNLSEISNYDYIPIAIHQTSLPPNEEQLFVKCKMTVIGAYKEYLDSAESTHLFSLKLDDVFHFPPFIKTSHMTSDKYLYMDDTLFLQCEFAFSYKSLMYASEFYSMPLSFKTKELCIKTTFIKSLEDLYMQQKFCDVHLQAGNKVLPAYKILLCARSSVFTAMFDHDMKEKNLNVVEITDVEPTTLNRMLEYIHLDVIKEELSLEDTYKLYKAADKYIIDSLRRLCSTLLISALCVANVCDILALADTHNDYFLMNAIHTFISTYSTETFHSIHWKSFMEDHPKLAMNIMFKWITGQQF